MMPSQTIQVGSGERRLLPSCRSHSGSYLLTCLRGQGALRVMSRSQIMAISNGAQINIAAADIATVSAHTPMTLLITESEEKHHDSKRSNHS